MSPTARWRSRSRLRVRLVASSALLSLLVIAVTVAALVAALHAEAQRQITAALHDRAAALTATVTVGADGSVDVAGSDDALFDTPNWLFDSTGHQVEGQRLPTALAEPIHALARTDVPAQRTAGAWHLRAVPIRHGGRIAAVGVTAVDGRPSDAALDSALRAAIAAGALAVVGATALAVIVLARGLGPIATMTQQAATWSRADSHRRFALGPPRDEVGALAAVLDGLLDRVEDALEAERRLTAEIAHELRTPLTALRAESELGLLAPPGPDAAAARFARIRDASIEMADAMTTLLDTERRGPVPRQRALLLPIVQDAVAAATAGSRVGFRILGGKDVETAVPPVVLQRILAPVLVNAAAAARAMITVEIETDGHRATVDVHDDGAGIDPAIRADLFSAGITGSVAGTGLGLGIARRVARSVHGDVVLVAELPARFRILLPGDHVR